MLIRCNERYITELSLEMNSQSFNSIAKWVTGRELYPGDILKEMRDSWLSFFKVLIVVLGAIVSAHLASFNLTARYFLLLFKRLTALNEIVHNLLRMLLISHFHWV